MYERSPLLVACHAPVLTRPLVMKTLSRCALLHRVAACVVPHAISSCEGSAAQYSSTRGVTLSAARPVSHPHVALT